MNSLLYSNWQDVFIWKYNFITVDRRKTGMSKLINRFSEITLTYGAEKTCLQVSQSLMSNMIGFTNLTCKTILKIYLCLNDDY